jgi:putative lipoprotein
MRLPGTLAVVLALVACADRVVSQPPPVVPAEGIMGIEWIAAEIQGLPADAAVRSTLRLEPDGRAYGSGGCNRFTGGARIEGSTLALGPLASTRMACAPPQGPQEDRYLQALNAARRYEIVEGRLRLLDANGAVLAVFSR